MDRERLDAALNRALGDKLTLVNKGFVQSLCLRFRGARESAELAYAGDVAETRRLMQLIREMQRLGAPLDPDGTALNAGRGEPDLQAHESALWRSDLKLAARNLDSLREAKGALDGSESGHEASPGLDRLIEEGAAYVTELQARADATGNLEAPETGRPVSDAEGNSLEDFLGSLKDTDERFLTGEIEAALPQNAPLFQVMNTVMCNHFLAIEQFFLQGFSLEHCGEKELGEQRLKHSIDEMNGAFRVVQRVLLLGSVPGPVYLRSIRLPHRVKIGRDPIAAVRNDLELTENLIVTLEIAMASPEVACGARTVDMLSGCLEAERNAQMRLSDQVEEVARGEASRTASGRFEAMLARYAIT